MCIEEYRQYLLCRHRCLIRTYKCIVPGRCGATEKTITQVQEYCGHRACCFYSNFIPETTARAGGGTGAQIEEITREVSNLGRDGEQPAARPTVRFITASDRPRDRVTAGVTQPATGTNRPATRVTRPATGANRLATGADRPPAGANGQVTRVSQSRNLTVSVSRDGRGGQSSRGDESHGRDHNTQAPGRPSGRNETRVGEAYGAQQRGHGPPSPSRHHGGDDDTRGREAPRARPHGRREYHGGRDISRSGFYAGPGPSRFTPHGGHVLYGRRGCEGQSYGHGAPGYGGGYGRDGYYH